MTTNKGKYGLFYCFLLISAFSMNVVQQPEQEEKDGKCIFYVFRSYQTTFQKYCNIFYPH